LITIYEGTVGSTLTERERSGPRSNGGWRVEPIHELGEQVLEAGVVVVGVLLMNSITFR
jgi:hypothetical protein